MNGLYLTALLACGVAAAQEQMIFQENFNNSGSTPPQAPYPPGPPLLTQRGWIFRNQCSPIGTINWLDGWSFSGASASDYEGSNLRTHVWNIAPSSTGTQSMWAILPNVPQLSSGDTFRVVLRSFGPNQHVELRLSSGGTSTGSGPTAVGDFTTLVADFVVPNNVWTPVSVAVPAGGRLAIRHFATQAGQSGPNAGGVWIDALEISEPSAPGVITWTAAESPHIVSGTVLIDANTILRIEAGATVQLEANSRLRIEGRAEALGTDGDPVVFLGTDGTTAGRVVIADGGLLELDYSDVQCWIEPLAGDIFGTIVAGDLTARNSTFHGAGRILTNGYVVGQPSVLVVEDCSFDSATTFWHQACQARLRNVTIAGGDVGLLLLGHVNLDNVAADGAGILIGDNKYGGQAQYLNNLSITNLPTRSGLLLDARNYLIGPNVVIQNTDAPIEFGDSGATGLLPGSVVPATGNTNNIVLDSDRDFPTLVMGAVWAPLAIPYVVPGGTLRATGDINILPGARIVLGEGTIWEWFGYFNAEGTTEQPIIFENYGPEFRWSVMATRTELARLDHCIIRGGGTGITTNAGNARVSNMTFTDMTGSALFSVDGSIWEVTKSHFSGNFGALTRSYDLESGIIDADGTLAPNYIAGNTYGASSRWTLYARDNWWGDASGPYDEFRNASGQGDQLLGGGVLFSQYETTAPDFSDTPPTVRILDTHHRVFEPGSKVIIHWTAKDDGTIVSQRVLFSPTDRNDSYQVIATLPAGQRSFEWTVPSLGGSSADTIEGFRVEALDDAGQTGWDIQVCVIPEDDSAGSLTIDTPLQPQHEFGDMFATTWTYGGWPAADLPSVFGRIHFENDFTWQDLGGIHINQGALSGNQFMGNVSTDFARINIKTNRSAFRTRHFFSQPFAIRPDPRMGDAPPTIALSGPAPSAPFAGGSVVPIRWSAGDDEGVRSFDIIASYDGGRWYYPVVRDLPATATGYDWQLPPSTGITDVRVRVIVRDLRFQNTSSEVQIAITSGDGADPGDTDGDGDVDLTDLATLLSTFGLCSGDAGFNSAADFDGSGCVELNDLAVLLAHFGT